MIEAEAYNQCMCEMGYCPSGEDVMYYFHSDHLGSSSYLTDASGHAYQFILYLPWGETMVEQNVAGFATPYKFNGKELDEETGLYNYGARYYDPSLSLFTSTDPLMDMFPDQSPYIYAYNNPVRFIDVDGLYGDESSAQEHWQAAIDLGHNVGEVYQSGDEWGFNVINGEDSYSNFGDNFIGIRGSSVYTTKSSTKDKASALLKSTPEGSMVYGALNEFYQVGQLPFTGRGEKISGLSSDDDYIKGSEDGITKATFQWVGVMTSPISSGIGSFGKVKYIRRMDDLKGIQKSKTFLDELTFLGTDKQNYMQNMSILRNGVRNGYIIRDASYFRPNSQLVPTLLNPNKTIGQTFLGAERLLMKNLGIFK